MTRKSNWRLALAFMAFFAACLAAYLIFARPWLLNWGSTPVERATLYPGDDAVPRFAYQTTRALDITAPPERAWAWQAQIGQDRGGFYSYSWLENLALADIHNATALRPEWREMRLGEPVLLTPKDYPLGLARRQQPDPSLAPRVSHLDPMRAFVLKGWGSFNFIPLPGGRTRLLLRGRVPPMTKPALVRQALTFDALHFVMERQMMRNVKRLAEGRPGTPAWLNLLAALGFFAIAAVAASFIFSRRRCRPWLLLPLLYSLLVVASTRDAQASLVAFAAVLLIIAGIIRFRIWWWAYILLMWLYAHAVLLFSADAFPVFGIAFLAAAAALRLKKKNSTNEARTP
jgi:hypothetical protein